MINLITSGCFFLRSLATTFEARNEVTRAVKKLWSDKEGSYQACGPRLDTVFRTTEQSYIVIIVIPSLTCYTPVVITYIHTYDDTCAHRRATTTTHTLQSPGTRSHFRNVYLAHARVHTWYAYTHMHMHRCSHKETGVRSYMNTYTGLGTCHKYVVHKHTHTH